jgi:hypothetical protein
MIIAVLIFRMCDSSRKKKSDDKGIQAQRPYSQYLLAALIGKSLLSHFNITVDKLSQKNFVEVKEYFDNNKTDLYEQAEHLLLSQLKHYFSENLFEIDGRNMTAAFRRFDFVEKVLA